MVFGNVAALGPLKILVKVTERLNAGNCLYSEIEAMIVDRLKLVVGISALHIAEEGPLGNIVHILHIELDLTISHKSKVFAELAYCLYPWAGAEGHIQHTGESLEVGGLLYFKVAALKMLTEKTEKP